MTDLSVIIPARNEVFLQRTIEDILANAHGDTEVIAVCDGNWPDPPVLDHPKVRIIHNTDPVGQRAATNDGVRLSRAKYVMKADAHCAFAPGFDVQLMKDHKHKNWTLIPQMYNMQAFEWVCKSCGHREGQGFEPEECESCHSKEVEMDVIWKPRKNRGTISWRFDRNMQFQYWHKHHRRHRRDSLIETMSFIGACFFILRDRFWELEGCDEAHGSWGQFGTEWACKSWLSGGKVVTTKNTWFGHMFRTGNFRNGGSSSFPYPLSGNQIERARKYSRDLWLNDKWHKAIYPLSWLVERFAPVPDWDTEAA